ncbi:MAG: hypothetical protein EDM03_02630 [Porphyrobacter sp. IPPAS B-1204]|nr:MAG: hypothetical protein EDM03_02630 [Porphyrobacter sp. IPPAS B-1204]
MTRLRETLSPDYLSQPYEKGGDPFSRYDQAEQIVSLYQGLEHGSVAILNGRWGAGKSTFAKKLTAHLKNKGISTTYFDAFAKDYVDSPFLALSAHIVSEIERKGNSSLQTSQAIKSTSKEIAKKMGSVSAKVLVKALTLGLIGASEIDDASKLIDAIGDASGEIAETAADQILENYIKIEQDFEHFRRSLDGLPEALQNSNFGSDGIKFKDRTVFIIDELDRCRPDFALGIIEIIKHLFDNDKIHFLLVTNIDYLISSVNTKYGLRESSSEYLEKFYDFLIFFETSTGDRYRHPAAQIVSQRIRSFLGDRQDRETAELIDSLQIFAKAFDLSLRQASSLATNASLAFLAVNDRTFRPSYLIAALALYRTKFPSIYQDIKRGVYTKDQILSVFEGVEFGDSFHDEHFKSVLEYYSARDGEIDREDKKYFGISQDRIRYHFGNFRDILPHMANNVMDNFGPA